MARLRGSTGTAVTVGEWLDRWLRDHAGAASTVAGYANHVRLYLDPHLGGLLPGELTVEHVREMFAAIVHDHQAEGRRIRQATLNRIRSTLRSALNTALRDGLIVENPAALLVMPVARRPRRWCGPAARVEEWERTGERPAVAVWTAEQTAAFLHAVRGHRLYAAYHLIALRGLRRGEAGGLRWVDVDLEHGTATICQQLQRRNGVLEPCPPKTAHSTRVIALDRTTISALRGHRSRQRAEAAACGERYRDSGYVFTNLNGDPVSPGRLTHVFQGMPAEHRLPPVRLHDLRHGAATLALAAGVELKVVQEMRGHSGIVLTADTYTGVLPKVAHTAAEQTATHVLRAGWRVPGTRRRRRPSGPGGRVAAARAGGRSTAVPAA
ncbi:tyrosine-type recombinase/integrase [Actinomadura welshii]|uniref:tyrosine-type recombinase/integrase n=1 Tax=Actinomadura welshii TaxID=3103817 RepID=UPI0004237F30|nr:site-specific integrase [Actinomadura madurae]